MAKTTGFFQLQSPLDLLKKMDSDYTLRLSKNPIDVYAAFDFFLTANHLPEWLAKAQCNPGPSRADPYGRALRAVCKQLANGAKHFDAKEHVAIERTSVTTPALYGLAAYGSFRYEDETGNLWIDLAEKEAEVLGRRAISAVELAGMVLTYWKEHDAVQRAAELLGFPNDIE